MQWQKRETKIASHYEFLRTKTGAFAGFIIKFNEGCYAWTSDKKLGNYNTIGEAKDAVEHYMDGQDNGPTVAIQQ